MNFWNYVIDIDSCYCQGITVKTRTHGIDMDSWYGHGLMVRTCNHGIHMDLMWIAKWHRGQNIIQSKEKSLKQRLKPSAGPKS